MFLGVGAINPTFLTLQNIWLCLNSSVVYTVVAVGISLVLITGEIDVSVGATLGMAAAISGTMIRNGQPWGLAIICALLVGLLIGCVNGFGVVVLKIPSIIMTLGINGIVRGLIYVYTDGKWIENIPFDFKLLSQGRLFGTVTFFYLGALILIVLVHLFLTKSKRGRYFAAIGDNIGGATLLGIPVDATKFSAYAMCGVFAAIGGVIFVSRVGFVTPLAGNGYEMKVIAACVLGGISLSGGVGSVIGAGVGAAIMASISRVLIFIGLSSDYDDTITGILLIIIVVSDALLRRRTVAKARRERLSAKTLAYDLEVKGGAGNE
ncbi:MAG: ABC transporter permease [Clostridiales bacterium]|nr:ABC transporter permease [Clostridiales bacterium]